MSVEGKFLSKEINDLFWREGLTLVTAESCTAGSVAAAITAVAGSSQFFKGGIIAYSNEIKESLLGVNHETLETHGAVSEETVIEMVKGAMKSMNSFRVLRELGYSLFHLAENVEKIFGSVKLFQMFQHGFVLISSFVRRSRCESGKTGIQFIRIINFGYIQNDRITGGRDCFDHQWQIVAFESKFRSGLLHHLAE